MHIKWILFGILGLNLLACGGGKGDPNYSHLQLADEKISPLQKPAQQSTFTTYTKNGMRLRVQGPSDDSRSDFATGAPEPAEADGEQSGGGNSGNFSTTNVLVEGVDEADRVKYDGDYLYIASSPFFDYMEVDSGTSSRPYQSSIRIMRTHPEEALAEEVAHLNLDDQPFSMAALYLVADTDGATQDLAAIGHEQTYSNGIWAWSPYWGNGNDRIHIRLFDVSSPTQAFETWSLELDGALAQSRKVGDILYVVSRYSPTIDGLQLYASSEDQRRANEKLIADASSEQLLPHYRVNGGNARLLVNSDNCYVPENLEQNDGYADLVTISAINLQTRELVSSVCLNTKISGLYTSIENIYLGTSAGDNKEQVTVVHKFRLNQGQIDYRGTGVVPGHIGWRAASYRMDEFNGDLRIVTTEVATDQTEALDDGLTDVAIWRPSELNHRLTVLRDQPGSNRMQTVAVLPNEQRPAEIGKPMEDIFAVRFHGERAYIVTFEQIDPLYVLDLSNSEDPRIAGELEVPGFSTYLHPIDGDYLLGVGKHSVNGWSGALKVELYDVRDVGNPQTLGTQLVGGDGTYSSALDDLRALNFLRTSDDQLRFTLPIDVSENFWWQHSALYLYEINGLAGDVASLDAAGSIVAEAQDGADPNTYWHGNNGHNARSRLHDDAVYFIYGSDVWSAFWHSPDAAEGPL